MSKAKDDYYNFLAYANRRLKDNDINSINEVIAEDITNYVTELEKKIVEYEKMLLEQCWNETVEKYRDVLTKLAKE